MFWIVSFSEKYPTSLPPSSYPLGLSLHSISIVDFLLVPLARIPHPALSISSALALTLYAAAAAAKSLQSCLTLCNPRDGSPPGSAVPGILQARTLEWVASASPPRALARGPGRGAGERRGAGEGPGASQGGHAVPLSRGGRAGPGGRWRAPVAAVARVRARVPFPHMIHGHDPGEEGISSGRNYWTELRKWS